MRSCLLILVLGTAPLLLFSLPVIAQILYLPLQNQTSHFRYNSFDGIDAVVVLRGGSDPSRIIQGVLAFNDYFPHFLVLSGYSGDEIILSTDKGKVIRCAVKEIRTAGRNTQGVRIFKLSGEEKVVSAIKIDDNFI